MINIEHLRKHFGAVRAVDDVSFDVARGEVVGLLGPNGAGKTTTMRIITGYLNADGGNVFVDGIPVSNENTKTRDRIGYLPENAPLYLDLEVTEYLDYIARLRKIKSGDRTKCIRKMVETCGLSEVVGRTTGQLSKGFRQRVGLAAAMIHSPPILILDEPTSGLDPNQIAEIRNLIREIGRERTVILSTHILQEVEATCSRALIISSGRLVGHGTIEELLHRKGVGASYTVCVRAPKETIDKHLNKLSGLQFSRWLSGDDSGKWRFSLQSQDGKDHSEDIFRWTVDCGFVLSELSHETASLEDVFRDLTQNQ